MAFKVVPITGYTTDLPIVNLGGSITQGSKVAANLRYVDMVGRYIGLNTYYHITNVNSGIGGNNSWMDLVRLATALTVYNPSVVVLDFAANNGTTDTDKATAEAIIRLVRTNHPDAFIVLIYFGSYSGWSSNNPTNSMAANKVYLSQLAVNYDCAELDIDAALAIAVNAGTFTMTQYTDDAVHPIAAGNVFIYNLLLPVIQGFYPPPITPQWSQNLGDYSYLFDNGNYENTPIIRLGNDNNGETGTWTAVLTTGRQSTVADSTIVWTGTLQSFGLDSNFGAGAGSVAYDIDGGGFTTVNLANLTLTNTLLWSGTREVHTITFKIISGTVKIYRFLAV